MEIKEPIWIKQMQEQTKDETATSPEVALKEVVEPLQGKKVSNIQVKAVLNGD